MSRTHRLVRRPRPQHVLLTGLLAVASVTAGCSAGEQAEPPSYDANGAVEARILPQLAANGEDTEAADDAAWVVEAIVADAEPGTTVELVADTGDGWETVDEAETDQDGEVALTSRDSGDLHVVVGDGDAAEGAKVSTSDAPEASFTDDFEEDTVDESDGWWFTRDQGFTGVRTCSRADASGAEVGDGVLKLSVLEDPSREGRTCQLPERRKRFPFRLNGHVGTEHAYEFTYGYAAARIKTQSARGQHAAFWLQSAGGQAPLGAKEGGAEIDVMEYFGDDHPQGGMTSFTYWLDEDGSKQTSGGWVKDPELYGDNWASEYHVFSVEWTPDEYVFRIDGQVTHRLEGETSGKPEFLILSLLSSDYELPRFNGELPEQMEVDWARVWETGPQS